MGTISMNTSHRDNNQNNFMMRTSFHMTWTWIILAVCCFWKTSFSDWVPSCPQTCWYSMQNCPNPACPWPPLGFLCGPSRPQHCYSAAGSAWAHPPEGHPLCDSRWLTPRCTWRLGSQLLSSPLNTRDIFIIYKHMLGKFIFMPKINTFKRKFIHVNECTV